MEMSSYKNNIFADYITVVKNLECYLHGTIFVNLVIRIIDYEP